MGFCNLNPIGFSPEDLSFAIAPAIALVKAFFLCKATPHAHVAIVITDQLTISALHSKLPEGRRIGRLSLVLMCVIMPAPKQVIKKCGWGTSRGELHA